MFKHLIRFWNGFGKAVGQPQESPVSPAQWQAAETRLPFLAHLDDGERQQLRTLALNFIQGKAWQGAQGLQVSLEMQLEIALQACVLILHRDPHEYAGWEEIIIYPGDFIIPRQEMDAAGVVHEFDDHVLGEAWDRGPVLLSWNEGSEQRNDGINVVIHEFAHKLDMANGSANGLPYMPSAARQQWVTAFEAAYIDFCRRVDSGEDTLIDPYAATAPAEFFAVLSEVFFETPALLRHSYPAVYTELVAFYGQTPL